jgi:hypothetical protein
LPENGVELWIQAADSHPREVPVGINDGLSLHPALAGNKKK